MATCATCGRQLDAAPLDTTCSSCSWRAAIRASQSAVAVRTPAADAEHTPSGSEDTEDRLVAAGDDPLELVVRLRDLAEAGGETLDIRRARRVYEELLRGNQRPYRAELNRLAGRFVGRLEDGWPA